MWERACPRWRCISQLMYRLTLSHRGIGIYTTLLSSAYWVCVHIRCCGHGHLGFRSYSGSLWKSPKVSKGLCPACRHLAGARCSLTPALLRGPPRWAIHGPARLNRRPAGLPAPHCLRSASGLLGQSDQNQKQEHSGLPAGLSVKSRGKIQSESQI